MTWTVVLSRLLAGVLAGGLIGVERQIHGRPAGLRTHILVCAGSCIAVIAGILASVDVGRIVAGLITGVGFLGAGTIVHYREGVGGLTTAACIWYTAMTGVVCGFGYLVFAGVATAAALVVLIVLDMVEDRLPAAAYWNLTIGVDQDAAKDSEKLWKRILSERGLAMKSTTVSIADGTVEYTLTLRSRYRRDFTGLVSRISRIPGIVSVNWTHRSGEL